MLLSSASDGAFATGIRPFPRNGLPSSSLLAPSSADDWKRQLSQAGASVSASSLGMPASRPLLGSASASGDGEAWKQKQMEIRDLQEASQSLLRRVGTNPSQSSTPSRPMFGDGGLETGFAGGLSLLRGAEDDENSVHGSAADLNAFSGRRGLLSGGLLSGGRTGAGLFGDRDGGGSSAGSAIAPLALMSNSNQPFDDTSSFVGSSAAAMAIASRVGAGAQAAARAPLGLASAQLAVPVPGKISMTSQKPQGAELRALREENASLRAEILDLRRAAMDSDKELRLQTAVARRNSELKEQIMDAEQRNATLVDEVERLRKAGHLSQLLAGDGQVNMAVRSYIENDMAKMLADRRTAEQSLRAEVQSWRERAELLEIELQSQAQQQRTLDRKVNSLEIYAKEAAAARATFSDEEARLQTQVDLLEAERQASSSTGDQEKRRMEDERRKAKRKMGELQQQNEESVAEAERVSVKAKESQKDMLTKLSDARQERQKVEGRLKKQVQVLQAECRDAQLLGTEANEALSKSGDASGELLEAQTRVFQANEECAVLLKRCEQDRSKLSALQHKSKYEAMEAGQHLQMELVKEHSRVNDEAWDRLSSIQEQHTHQIHELHKVHNRDTSRLTSEMQETTLRVEQQQQEDEFRAAERVQSIHSELQAEYQVCLEKSQQVETLESHVHELKHDLVGAREEAGSSMQQHEALLSVLRRERQVADNQFQDLLRHTEEKQKAIHHLQNEVSLEGVSTPSPVRAARRVPGMHDQRGCPVSNMPPLITSAVSHVAHSVDSNETPRSEDLRAALAGAEDQDNGVAAMLSQLSVEREVHETRHIADELEQLLTTAGANFSGNVSGMLSPGVGSSLSSSGGNAAGSDWRNHAKHLLEQLLLAYEHASHHATEETMRVDAGKQREQNLRDYFGKVEAKVHHKHEHELQGLRSQNQQRLSLIETEAVKMEQALQSAFDSERSELVAAAKKAQDSLTSEVAEYQAVRSQRDVLRTAEASIIQSKIEAVEARLDADTREEFAEVKWKTQAERAEMMSTHESSMERLRSDHARKCQQLENATMDDNEETRNELSELSQSLHRELMAARDEQGSFTRQEAKLEARVESCKHDVSESQIEVSETRSALELELDQRKAEVRGLESTMQGTARKAQTERNELSANIFEQQAEMEHMDRVHGEEREVLAREIQVFQDEKDVVDERLRQQTAFAEARFQTFREELEDVEIDLQRTEAVCAERGRLLKQGSRTPGMPRARAVTSAPMSPSSRKRAETSPDGRPASPVQRRATDFDFGGSHQPTSGTSSPSHRQARKGTLDLEEHIRKEAESMTKQLKLKLQLMHSSETQAFNEIQMEEEKNEMQMEQWARSERDFKGQLGQLREDKLRERQMKDRQLDKLKGRVSELVTSSETNEKQNRSEAALQRRQTDEYRERLDKSKGESKKLQGFLQESQAERVGAQQDVEVLRQELSKSEDLLGSNHKHCQEMAQERRVAQQTANACLAENQSMQVTHDNEIRTIADLEMQLEHTRRQTATTTNQLMEARSSIERLCQAFTIEIKDISPMLPELEQQELADQQNPGGMPTETTVVASFKALARFVSDLARKNAELRSEKSVSAGSVKRPAKTQEDVDNQTRQIATLQKDILKSKEENQEVRLEARRLEKQLSESNRLHTDAKRHIEEVQKKHDGLQRDLAQRQCESSASNAPSRSLGLLEEDAIGSPGMSPERSRGPISPTSPILSESRNTELDELTLRAKRTTPSFGGLSNTEMRLRLRQLDAEKLQLSQSLFTYKSELKSKTSELNDQLEEMKAQLWESRHERENETDLAQKQVAKFDRKIRYLEGKLRERMETERQVIEEKEVVEEQLNLAAKQLEALLAEEGKDGDLQRDLAGLSQQFEQLHGKHRQQLSKAQEMNKTLEREREKRQHVEEQLHNHEMQIDRELRLAHERHMEQMNKMQDQVQALRQTAQTKEKDMQESLAENTSLNCELSTLQSLQQQQAMSIQEFQDEVHRLQEELKSQTYLLREARDKGPGSKDALHKLRLKEDECEELVQALEDATAGLKRSQTEAKASRFESEDLRRSNDQLREEVQRREDALRISQDTLERQRGRLRGGEGSPVRPSQSPPREQRDVSGQREQARSSSPGSSSSSAQLGWEQSYPESSRSSRRPGELAYDRGRGVEDPGCVVRTVEDNNLDGTAPSGHLSVQRSPAPEEVRNQLQGQAGLLSSLGEILGTLDAHQRDLEERKAGFGDSGGAANTVTRRSFPSDALGPHASRGEVDDDFIQVSSKCPNCNNTGIDFTGNPCACGQERMDYPSMSERPPSPPRPTPIADDVQLKDPEGRPAAVRGYPDSPPGSTRGVEAPYPSSTSREDWQATAPGSGPSGASVGAKEGPSLGLPPIVRDQFRRAESLCERLKFDEAVPCFQQVLQILEGGSPEVEGVQPVVVAEVWAHLGVAMQSLDKVREAIDSYKRAVTLDVSLHVCFANLATLHAYLNEHEAAAGYIEKALVLDPNNGTYSQIRQHLEDATPQSASTAPSGSEANAEG